MYLIRFLVNFEVFSAFCCEFCGISWITNFMALQLREISEACLIAQIQLVFNNPKNMNTTAALSNYESKAEKII